MADTGAYVSNRQIEAARIAMTRYMKRGGKVWIRIFPHMARTKKPLEVRMGSGKGAPEGWVAVVKMCIRDRCNHGGSRRGHCLWYSGNLSVKAACLLFSFLFYTMRV